MTLRFYRAAALMAAGLLILLPARGQAQPMQGDFPLHSPMPEGYSVVLLQPSRARVSILGLVECPEIEGVQRVSQGVKAFLISPDGVRMKQYPRELNFRVTATLRKTLLDEPTETIATRYDPQKFLLKLGFKLKIHHGLERREIFPRSIKMIGMPGDVPYDERVFRVNFDIGNLPVTDRLVLEILSPEDEVLTHFTFGLL